MISMSKVHSIRQMRTRGHNVSEVSRTLEVSRDTVCKYLEDPDLSPQPPTRRKSTSVMDQYRPLIISWLEEDAKGW